MKEAKINEIRRNNLKEFIKQSGKEDYRSVAETIGRAEATLRKYLTKNSGRSISDNLAREIEEKLELPQGYLDQDTGKYENIYYVMLQVDDSSTYDTIQWIYKYCQEVVDCSAILGHYDIMLKVKVPNFHYLEKFFIRLSRLPRVVRTETFASVDSLRWQRNQSEYFSVENPRRVKNFVDHYKENRMNDLKKQISELERGKIIAPESVAHSISLLEIMDWTKRSFDSVREYEEEIDQQKNHLEKERDKIKDGIVSRQIFLFPKKLMQDDSLEKERQEFFKGMRGVINVKSQVRFISNEEFLVREENLEPECFAVVDDEFVYVRKHGKDSQRAALHENEDYVEMYQKLFNQNWDAATPYDEKKHS